MTARAPWLIGTDCAGATTLGRRWSICASPRTPRMKPPRPTAIMPMLCRPRPPTLKLALKRRLLADPDRPGVAAVVGEHALRLWETDVTTFDPIIKPDLEEEARVSARYTELLASAKLEIAGNTVNLAGLGPVRRGPGPIGAARSRTGPLALLRGKRRGAGRTLRPTRKATSWHGSQARLRDLHPARISPIAAGRLWCRRGRPLPRSGGCGTWCRWSVVCWRPAASKTAGTNCGFGMRH